MKALIVDDSSAMRSYLTRILLPYGFLCSHAADGDEALQVLAKHEPFDLVLLDWNMPLRDGLQTLRDIRRRHEFDGIRIMIVTTEIDQDRILLALDCGANEYLMKPFTPEIVDAKLTLLGFEAVVQ
jgi:two-component system, chemotaxis family, chemotaxis protein CheY